MQFFVVRHIDTGHILPYIRMASHWNPEVFLEGIPRLFPTEKSAKTFITTWARGIHYRFGDPTEYKGDRLYAKGADIRFDPVPGRSADQLEIVPATMSFGDPL